MAKNTTHLSRPMSLGGYSLNHLCISRGECFLRMHIKLKLELTAL